MKNVLLLGDSIRHGYDKAVQKTLEGKANVYFPQDNCRFAAYLLRTVHEYKSLIPEGEVDVLHWNAGLWDCLRLFGEDPQTPVDLYALSCTLPEEAHSDAVHYYTPMGTEAFANQVLSVLCPALGIEETLEYREALHTDAPVGV